jgi:hypothetical protein
MRLNIKAFAFASGLFWGVSVFLLTWWLIALEGATGEATMLGRIYKGYSISPGGSLIGLGWALVDGCIAGAIFAWLYNFMLARIRGSEEARS